MLNCIMGNLENYKVSHLYTNVLWQAVGEITCCSISLHWCVRRHLSARISLSIGSSMGLIAVIVIRKAFRGWVNNRDTSRKAGNVGGYVVSWPSSFTIWSFVGPAVLMLSANACLEVIRWPTFTSESPCQSAFATYPTKPGWPQYSLKFRLSVLPV